MTGLSNISGVSPRFRGDFNLGGSEGRLIPIARDIYGNNHNQNIPPEGDDEDDFEKFINKMIKKVEQGLQRVWQYLNNL